MNGTKETTEDLFDQIKNETPESIKPKKKKRVSFINTSNLSLFEVLSKYI